MKDAFEYTDKLPVLPSYRYMVWITQDGFTMLSKIAVFTYLYWNLSKPWFSEAAATGVTQVTLAQVFSCEFGEFLRTLFLQNTSGRLLLGFLKRHTLNEDFWLKSLFFSNYPVRTSTTVGVRVTELNFEWAKFLKLPLSKQKSTNGISK